MPLIEAAGTNVARIRPDSVKNSMPPERIWLSMSVSEPSWLFGNICRSNLPPVSALMAAAISLARALSGWPSGQRERQAAIRVWEKLSGRFAGGNPGFVGRDPGTSPAPEIELRHEDS